VSAAPAAPARVALMITCLADMFYPEVGERIVRLLRRLGVEVTLPAGQTCCGLPLFNSGYHHEAATVARRTVALFRDADAVVVPSGSCAWMIKHEYAGLLRGHAEAADAARVAERTYEFSQFLVRRLGRTMFESDVEGPLAYHDSCHLLRGLHESESPRVLLRELTGAEFVELPGADECCGFCGSFSVRLPDVSGAILRRKLEAIRATGADTVVACDAGCLMQIAGGLARAGDRVRARHLAEVLAEAGDG
jgi:L-lactate dehydrogenase complex protein LldE